MTSGTISPARLSAQADGDERAQIAPAAPQAEAEQLAQPDRSDRQRSIEHLRLWIQRRRDLGGDLLAFPAVARIDEFVAPRRGRQEGDRPASLPSHGEHRSVVLLPPRPGQRHPPGADVRRPQDGFDRIARRTGRATGGRLAKGDALAGADQAARFEPVVDVVGEIVGRRVVVERGEQLAQRPVEPASLELGCVAEPLVQSLLVVGQAVEMGLDDESVEGSQPVPRLIALRPAGADAEQQLAAGQLLLGECSTERRDPSLDQLDTGGRLAAGRSGYLHQLRCRGADDQ